MRGVDARFCTYTSPQPAFVFPYLFFFFWATSRLCCNLTCNTHAGERVRAWGFCLAPHADPKSQSNQLELPVSIAESLKKKISTAAHSIARGRSRQE